MVDKILTTGGAIDKNTFDEMVENISLFFNCDKKKIKNVKPLQKGITNCIFEFSIGNIKYVYRVPGNGSDILVEREREAMVQEQASSSNIDNTLLSMSVSKGWRIAKYIDGRILDYSNIDDVILAVQLLRRMHDIEFKVRYEFDVMDKIEQLANAIPSSKYGDNFTYFQNFSKIKSDVLKLYSLSQTDGIKKCITHGDCRDENFLVSENDINLIDWEYGGYNDPGFDLGSFICGGKHSREEVDTILFIYYGKNPTYKQKRHFYAWVAITGFFYMHWTMFKESRGQKVGYLKELWYNYAKEYSLIALDMYQKGE